MHADVTLYLGPQQVKLPAHYAILSIRTNYFDTAKEGGWQEASTNEFRFTGHSTYALYRMLQYVYTGDYSLEVGQLGDCVGTVTIFFPFYSGEFLLA